MISVVLFTHPEYSIGLGLAPHRIIDISLIADLIYLNNSIYVNTRNRLTPMEWIKTYEK